MLRGRDASIVEITFKEALSVAACLHLFLRSNNLFPLLKLNSLTFDLRILLLCLVCYQAWYVIVLHPVVLIPDEINSVPSPLPSPLILLKYHNFNKVETRSNDLSSVVK